MSGAELRGPNDGNRQIHHMYSPIVSTLQQYCDGASTRTSPRRRCKATLVVTSNDHCNADALAAHLRSLPVPDIFIGIGMASALDRVPWTWLASEHVTRIKCKYTLPLITHRAPHTTHNAHHTPRHATPNPPLSLAVPWRVLILLSLRPNGFRLMR